MAHKVIDHIIFANSELLKCFMEFLSTESLQKDALSTEQSAC